MKSKGTADAGNKHEVFVKTFIFVAASYRSGAFWS
jgi:hypothetical protein